jgi:hypothetical protein
VYDIAADLKGGFIIGEPGQAPRRIAQIARDGSLVGEWFGGMSFYVNGTFDPGDPSCLIGIAPEGSVNVYRIDYDTGTWEVEACYATGRLGDSLFPHATAFRAIRRKGQLYLYSPMPWFGFLLSVGKVPQRLLLGGIGAKSNRPVTSSRTPLAMVRHEVCPSPLTTQW